MSVLKTYGRPYVQFDPTNKDHRLYLSNFINNRAWGDCPVRFVIEDQGSYDLVALMQQKLLKYYTSVEFDEKA